MEIMRDGRMLLFDYLHRDALLGNARIIEAGRIGQKDSGKEPEPVHHFNEKWEQ